MVVLYVIAALLCICAAILFGLHLTVNDRKVPAKAWKPKEHTLLAVFAHPDDEVMVAGTLAALARHGGRVHLLYLTHGEDGPTGGLVEKSGLGQRRRQELEQVKEILGAASLEVLDFPDRYLNTCSIDIVQQEIQSRISQYQPDTVLCFDAELGLYGHTDHAFSGRCTQELLVENAGSVRHLLVMTLPAPMIKLAVKVSKTFADNYKAEKGLPGANLAVKIAAEARKKMGVVRAHKTQWQVMQDVQPLYNKIPYFVYYRIFSREYFNYSLLL